MKTFLPPILLIISINSFTEMISAQSSDNKLDSTFSVFWEKSLRLRLQVLNPDAPDMSKNNAVLKLYSGQGSTVIYMDSLFAYTISMKVADYNGDGIADLLIYNASNGTENRSYHLYIVDQKKGTLKRVKGFEKVFNPYFDHNKCLIYGFESFGKKMKLGRYRIDKNGLLSMVGWD